MMMNGKLITTIPELMRNFCIDELVGAYYSGELEFFLIKLGDHKKVAALREIENNAFLLVRLYEVFCLDPKLTEEEIRDYFS